MNCYQLFENIFLVLYAIFSFSDFFYYLKIYEKKILIFLKDEMNFALIEGRCYELCSQLLIYFLLIGCGVHWIEGIISTRMVWSLMGVITLIFHMFYTRMVWFDFMLFHNCRLRCISLLSIGFFYRNSVELRVEVDYYNLKSAKVVKSENHKARLNNINIIYTLNVIVTMSRGSGYLNLVKLLTFGVYAKVHTIAEAFLIPKFKECRYRLPNPKVLRYQKFLVN